MRRRDRPATRRENDAFGVINVGDDAKLVTLCEEHDGLRRSPSASSQDFALPRAQRPHSTVNLLIGSKKFTEGWNSWRVSTMGLMNVGKSEGSQIIQLFGRGVRLRGCEGSLKRSSAFGPDPPDAAEHIGVLETLGIFGVHADYMATFRDFLDEEGLPTGDVEEVLLPVRIDLGDRPLLTVGIQNEVDGQTTEFGLAFRNKAPVVTLLGAERRDRRRDAAEARELRGRELVPEGPVAALPRRRSRQRPDASSTRQR